MTGSDAINGRLEILSKSRSLSTLVIVPHPDDEALIAGGVIYGALESGRTVKVVIVTNGDLLGRETGLLRQKESIDAMGMLGLGEEHIIFLGYPDDINGLLSMLNSFGDDVPYKSGTGIDSTYGECGFAGCDFHSWLTGLPGRYTAAGLRGDIDVLVDAWRPVRIYTTSRFDEHPDHRAVFYIVAASVRRVRSMDSFYVPEIYTAIVHDPVSAPYDDFSPVGTRAGVIFNKPDFAGDNHWPEPEYDGQRESVRFDASRSFSEPPSLRRTGLSWQQVISMPVPAPMGETAAEANLKFRVINCYASQPLQFLASFCKSDEIFWKEEITGSGDAGSIA